MKLKFSLSLAEFKLWIFNIDSKKKFSKCLLEFQKFFFPWLHFFQSQLISLKKLTVLLPTFSKTFALVYLVISWVISKYPKAPAPLAWTTRSGILSRSKWAISSMKLTSWSKTGPRGPTVWVAVFTPIGAPWPVVAIAAPF